MGLTSNFYSSMPVGKSMLRRENKNIGTISTHHSCLKKAHMSVMGNWLCSNTLLLFVLKVCPRIVLKYIIITGLNKLIKKLDRRHETHMVKKKTPSFRQYRRVVSSPSKAKPKKNSPAWAINTEDSEQSGPSTSTPNSSLLSSPLSCTDSSDTE